MYGNYAMQQPPWWMFPPQGPTSPMPPQNPAEQITGWIRSLEELKKAMKEEKKEEKKPEKKGPNPSVLLMMLFMMLVSPITGPAMYHFFQLSLGIIK